MATDRHGFISRTWESLQATELRLWHMILAALFTTLITTGAPILADRWKSQSDHLIERSGELVEVASDFENSVNRMVHSADTIEAFAPDKIAALTLNVEAQIKALNKVVLSIQDEHQKSLADAYASKLVTVRNMLQNGLQPSEVKSFGIAAQELVLLRNQFLSSVG